MLVSGPAADPVTLTGEREPAIEVLGDMAGVDEVVVDPQRSALVSNGLPRSNHHRHLGQLDPNPAPARESRQLRPAAHRDVARSQRPGGSVGVSLAVWDGNGSKFSLLVAEGRFVGLAIGNGVFNFDVDLHGRGPIEIAAIGVDHLGHVGISNRVTVWR